MPTTLEAPVALLAGEGLPDYAAITPEQVTAHMPGLLAELDQQLNHLEADLTAALEAGAPLSWQQVMGPLQRLGERLRWSWGVVSHLNGVCNGPELRSAHAGQQAAVVAFGSRVGQSRVLYRALESLQASDSLDGTQQRILAAERPIRR